MARRNDDSDLPGLSMKDIQQMARRMGKPGISKELRALLVGTIYGFAVGVVVGLLF